MLRAQLHPIRPLLGRHTQGCFPTCVSHQRIAQQQQERLQELAVCQRPVLQRSQAPHQPGQQAAPVLLQHRRRRCLQQLAKSQQQRRRARGSARCAAACPRPALRTGFQAALQQRQQLACCCSVQALLPERLDGGKRLLSEAGPAACCARCVAFKNGAQEPRRSLHALCCRAWQLRLPLLRGSIQACNCPADGGICLPLAAHG